MANPSLNEFTNGCRSCSARALAAIRIDLMPEPDRVAALEKVAPGDPEYRGVVREWVKRIQKQGARK